MKLVLETERFESASLDGSESRYGYVDENEDDEGFYVGLFSWSRGRGHPEITALNGRRVRITIEVIDH